MNPTGMTAPLVLALAAVLLAGCDDDERGAAEDETAAAEVAQVLPPSVAREPLWAFRPAIADDADALANRIPAEPSRMILVPSTTLFPGMARIDPDVKNPISGDSEAIAAGERHFAAFNCAGCHAPLGGGGMGPPLSDDDWIYGSEAAQIFLTIMHGRPEGMPAFGSMLPAQVVWELVAYIETLNDIEDYAAELGFDEGGRFRDFTEGHPEQSEQGSE